MSTKRSVSIDVLVKTYGSRRKRQRESLEAARPGDDRKDTKVAIAQGLHLFPFRTEKLNLATPMILRKWESR